MVTTTAGGGRLPPAILQMCEEACACFSEPSHAHWKRLPPTSSACESTVSLRLEELRCAKNVLRGISMTMLSDDDRELIKTAKSRLAIRSSPETRFFSPFQ